MKKYEKEIKAQIDRLHEQNSGDFQTLLRQIEKKRRRVQLNLPQVFSAMATAPLQILEWARGTGKTTNYAYHISEIGREMPRSTGLFVGPSYQYILTRILPSLIQGLEMFGLYQGLHYFVGQEPPRSWRKAWQKAYQPPLQYGKYITFWNGVGIHLISQDVPGDGRALNSDWIVADEAAMLDPRKLQENTDPTLRGTRAHLFKEKKYFGWKNYTSSTPLTPEGRWFTDYEDKARRHPEKIKFISATSEHNMHNLRPGYLEDAERDAYSQLVYLAEYKNIRPKFTKDGFYALLDADRHGYNNYDYDHYTQIGQASDCRGDADLTKGQPLILGVDWGAAINCLTVNQYLRSINEYRTLKSMYVLGEDLKIQDDLFLDFHNYYQYHNSREVLLYFDNTGNLRTGNTKLTRAQQARKVLTDLGWKVRLLTTGNTNPLHEYKYLLWQAILKENLPSLPNYRINMGNCKELFVSMRNSKTVQGRNGEIKKDKSLERSGKVPRQEATDLSDANDSPIFQMFYHLLRQVNTSLPGVRTTS